MSRNFLRFGSMVLVLAGAWGGAGALGQEREQPGREAAPLQSGPPAAQPLLVGDEEMASWLLLDCMAQIQISQPAVTLSQSEEARGLAQKMVQEHLAMIERIQRAGYGQSVQAHVQAALQEVAQEQAEQERRRQQLRQQPAPGGNPAGPARQQPARPNAPQIEAPRAGAEQPAGVEWMQLKQALTSNSTNLILGELELRRGIQFDVAYLHNQIVLNQQMLAALQTFQMHASPQLAAVLGALAPAKQSHLQQAHIALRDLALPEPKAAPRLP